jgi:hypothetical protein
MDGDAFSFSMEQVQAARAADLVASVALPRFIARTLA